MNRSSLKMSQDSERFQVPKFKGEDFSVCKVQMHALLTAKGIESTLKEPTETLKGDAATAFLKANATAKALLLLALDAKYVRHVMHFDYA